MDARQISIACSDGFVIAGCLFEAPDDPLGTVVVAPALGVPQDFYRPMAGFLAANGFHAVTFDYRGIGRSRSTQASGSEIRMDQWGSLDMDAVLGAAHDLPGGALFLLGHSAGGQLFGLAPNSEYLDGVIMVSSLIPWWRSFPWPWSIRVWILMHLVMPLFSRGRNDFPARRLGISSVDVPSGVTRQWSRWGRRPDYFFDERWGLDLHRYASFDFPVLVCHVDDDDYAPWLAIQRLLEKLPRVRKEIWHIDSSRSTTASLGHVGFFREAMEDIYWGKIADWLNRHSAKCPRDHYA
jgi:predicted alpha/beta hydrolase